MFNFHSTKINTISSKNVLLIKKLEGPSRRSISKFKTYQNSNKLKNLTIKILSKDSNTRTPQELLIVRNYLLKQYDYFTNLESDEAKIKMEAIALISKLEKFKPNEAIMMYGTISDKFYIVLEGQVEVFLPEYYEAEMTHFEFLKLLEKIKREDKFKYIRLKSKNKGVNFDNINTHIDYNDKNFKENKFKFLLEKNIQKGEYREGFAFGDMSLIEKTTKNLIVKSIEESTCISIAKNECIKAMKEIEIRNLLKDINSFKKKYQFFNCFNNDRIKKVFNCFSKVLLYKGDYLFHQNDINDCIYIVVRGNFEVYSYISYSWLNEYYNYIDDSAGNILFYMISNPNLNIEELQELIENIKLNVIKSPMKNLDYSICNDINISNKNNLKDNLYYIKYDEEQMNDNKNIFKINLNKVDYNEIFGLEDCFDFKNKFYSVKCTSESAELKCIKISDLLNIIWNSKKNDYLYILKLVINKKNILKNKIINSVKNLEKKILDGFDTRYENLINSENNIYNKNVEISNDLTLSKKLKSNNLTIKSCRDNNKRNELVKNRIFSAIKLNGYSSSIQDILDKRINILPQEISFNDKKMLLMKKSINFQILKNLLKSNNHNTHLFKFNKKLFKTFYSFESKSESLSQKSKKITNYTTFNNGVRKSRNISAFSGLNNDKKENDDISNNSNRLNKTNIFGSNLKLVNKNMKTPNYSSFYTNKKNQNNNLDENIKQTSNELKFNEQDSLKKFNSFIIPRFSSESKTYITSAKHNFKFFKKKVSYGLNNNIPMIKPYMSPEEKLENKKKDIFGAVRKIIFIKKSLNEIKSEDFLKVYKKKSKLKKNEKLFC